MKKVTKNDSTDPKKRNLIEKALRYGGYSFPQTIDEVSEFERLFGSTDVLLPPDLQEPFFLYAMLDSNPESNKMEDQRAKFSLAAREASSQLPEDIVNKIIRDIQSEEAKCH